MAQVSPMKVAMFRELMKDGKARTAPEAGDILKIHGWSASHAMKVLHDEKALYVHDYRVMPNGGYVAIYRFGPGVDADKPKRKTRDEINAARRKEREDEAMRESQWCGEFVPFRDPLVAAFYGEYQREAA